MKKPFFTFKGSRENPFLAPRGIFIHNQIMAVCDTAHNRVFIWTTIPTMEYQEPDIILGTQESEPSATSFYYPSGLWTDGIRLIVADAWNHRVLIWHTFPQKNYTPADIVVGQKDFNQNKPNVEGVNTPSSNQNLYWCYGVFSNGKELWIADTGNRRVLYFAQIPIKNFLEADEVIGQLNFETKDLVPSYPTWPYSVKISPNGEMLISDTQYFRVHYWKSWKQALSNPSDILFGQNNHSENGQNQYNMKPKSNTLNWVYDAIFDAWSSSILIADTGNSRVLQWNKLPNSNNEVADVVFGQKGFEEIGENKESIMGMDDYMYWPFSLTAHSDFIAVCETGNNRIFFYKRL